MIFCAYNSVHLWQQQKTKQESVVLYYNMTLNDIVIARYVNSNYYDMTDGPNAPHCAQSPGWMHRRHSIVSCSVGLSIYRYLLLHRCMLGQPPSQVPRLNTLLTID